jgi:hypothetical protein
MAWCDVWHGGMGHAALHYTYMCIRMCLCVPWLLRLQPTIHSITDYPYFCALSPPTTKSVHRRRCRRACVAALAATTHRRTAAGPHMHTQGPGVVIAAVRWYRRRQASRRLEEGVGQGEGERVHTRAPTRLTGGASSL